MDWESAVSDLLRSKLDLIVQVNCLPKCFSKIVDLY